MSADIIRVNYADLQNPLFIHPSDGPRSLSVGEKLTITKNYRTWRRGMEIGLSTKHKLVLVLGTLSKPNDDPIKAAHWEACNNLVISWILNNVSDSIVRSILYIQSASVVWNHLQRRLSLSQGSRKYKLIKDVYSVKQDGHSMSEYYTVLRGIWEELDAMNKLPKITTVTEDVTRFLNALLKQQEELKLFQFLNGLDEKYQTLRSQIRIMNPLPPVDTACGMIQQEELQREVLEIGKHIRYEASTLYSK